MNKIGTLTLFSPVLQCHSFQFLLRLEKSDEWDEFVALMEVVCLSGFANNGSEWELEDRKSLRLKRKHLSALALLT